MTRNDPWPILALLLAMFVAPALLGALQQGEQRPRPVLAEAAIAPSATPLRTPTARPTLGISPGPTATVFVIEIPTANPWLRPPPYRALEPMSEREAVEWLRSVGQ